MGKLRHIAVSTPDLDKSTKFYEEVFDMKIMSQQDHVVRMSDGVVNLTLFKFKSDERAGDERGKDFCRWHHVGFIVDDLDETRKKLKSMVVSFIRICQEVILDRILRKSFAIHWV